MSISEAIYPDALKAGDCVAIVATSSPGTEESLARSKKFFEDKGYKVKTGKHILRNCGYLAGYAEERAADYNEAVKDNDVKAIFTLNGGKGANAMLPLLDFDAIKNNPKIHIGVSNPTILMNAITASTGLVTFHGPTGYNFGMSEMKPYMIKWFWETLEGKIKAHYFLDCDEAEVFANGSDVQGQLIGGHLGTNISLIGTKWEPDWNGKILLLEEFYTPLERIEAMITHLDLIGALDKINGMIFGRSIECKSEHPADASMGEMLARLARGRFPILGNIAIGHMSHAMTVPLGVEVSISTADKTIKVLNSGVK